MEQLVTVATEELERGLGLLSQMAEPPERGEIWLRAWFTSSDLTCLLATAQFVLEPPEVNGLTLFREAAQLVAARPKNFELFWLVRHVLEGALSYTYVLPREDFCQVITVAGSLPAAALALFEIEQTEIGEDE